MPSRTATPIEFKRPPLVRWHPAAAITVFETEAPAIHTDPGVTRSAVKLSRSRGELEGAALVHRHTTSSGVGTPERTAGEAVTVRALLLPPIDFGAEPCAVYLAE